MRDLQPLALDPFQTFDNRLHRSALSRKHDAGRPIHGGDGKRRSLALFGRVGCEKLPHTPFVALHRHHDSPLRQCAHQPSACGGQLQPILQAEDPAMQAAAISPTLWPSSRSGFPPQESQSVANAYSRAKRAGCAFSVQSMASASFSAACP